ncbi:MAG TPA: class A beta-lactamase [Rhizomicrobium sp.]|nr:class A beta-lactamase [Rhizomicrobium sp.]
MTDFHRRSFVLAALGLLGGATQAWAESGADAAFKQIEARLGGRVGLSVLDTGNGKTLSWRGGERFAMCSSFKWVLAASVLSRADKGQLYLNETIAYGSTQLLPHSPITGAHVKEGHMRIEDLCAAAVEESDNGAANLLLARIGGPKSVTAYARSVGDNVTRLDRNEPSLNDNLPGDPRDTTTPDAMVQTMKMVLIGDALRADSRARLLDWLRKSDTGAHRLRAGLPQSWNEGDKTGTGERGAAVDTAIIWPPHRAPILAAAYVSDSTKPTEQLEAAIADLGRLIGTRFA